MRVGVLLRCLPLRPPACYSSNAGAVSSYAAEIAAAPAACVASRCVRAALPRWPRIDGYSLSALDSGWDSTIMDQTSCVGDGLAAAVLYSILFHTSVLAAEIQLKTPGILHLYII